MIEPSAGLGCGGGREGRDGLLSELHPYRLWSLWEMLEIFANHWIGLGQLLGRFGQIFEAIDEEYPLTGEEIDELRDLLKNF